jgi:hypothetical protein
VNVVEFADVITPFPPFGKFTTFEVKLYVTVPEVSNILFAAPLLSTHVLKVDPFAGSTPFAFGSAPSSHSLHPGICVGRNDEGVIPEGSVYDVVGGFTSRVIAPGGIDIRGYSYL